MTELEYNRVHRHRLLQIEDRLEPVEFDKFVSADLSHEQIRRDMVKKLDYV